jgi:transcriptional regulator with XRE-family HTH domain
MGFKENLRSELDFQDMMVKELSEKTGINKRTLDNYLSGHNSIPSAEIALKIAHALGVSVEYLLTGKEPQYLALCRTKSFSLKIFSPFSPTSGLVHVRNDDKKNILLSSLTLFPTVLPSRY